MDVIGSFFVKPSALAVSALGQRVWNLISKRGAKWNWFGGWRSWAIWGLLIQLCVRAFQPGSERARDLMNLYFSGVYCILLILR